MTLTERLAASVAEVLSNQRLIFDDAPGHCLHTAREAICEALGYGIGEAWRFHNDFSFSRVEGNEEGTAWARSAQRTMRDELGMRVSVLDAQIGDWVFNHKLAWPFGHVAVVVAVTKAGPLIFENTSSSRGVLHSGFNRISELRLWPYVAQAQLMRFKETA